MSTPAFRDIPSVDAILGHFREADGAMAHSEAVSAVRQVLDGVRAGAAAGTPVPAMSEILDRVRTTLDAAARRSLQGVINATGVILQTNLGRAPLSAAAMRAMEAVARGYSNLEFDLAEGQRGSRHEHVRDLVRRATGAEDGIVVNNNAAALFMVLQVFAAGRDVIVSRGQAVEIGGGFRIPDVLRQSGARLVEVGTTNRTYARDYAEALTAETAAILRVHPSNFRVEGFTAAPSLAELVEVAQPAGALVLDDLGSGCLVETTAFGLAHEPTVQESLRAGADLVLFSGDKLLGGPQCGVVAGRTALVERLRRHPLARALRVDKLTVAALNATLRAYVEGTWEVDIPVWRMVGAEQSSLRRRARRWATAAGGAGTVVRSTSMVGGGSLPGAGLPTWCTALRPAAAADVLAAALRAQTPPIVARVAGGAVLLDPRTVDPAQDRTVGKAIRGVVAAS